MRKRWLQTIHNLAKKDERIVFIGSDLSADPAIKRFQADVPERFFMEGVSEAHVIGMASGLAMSGLIVYINTIATFITRRCFEQNVIDLGLTQANVRLFGSGGGLVYAPMGPTHLAIEDVGIMRMIPNMTIIAPSDADEMERALGATIEHKGPIYFRVAKGGDDIISRPQDGFKLGKPVVYRNPGEVLLLSTGVMTQTALKVADMLSSKGIDAGVAHIHTLKPLEAEDLLPLMTKSKFVVTLEEHVVNGGLGTIVAEIIADSGAGKFKFKRLGLPDFFPDSYGSQNILLDKYGLSPEKIFAEVTRSLNFSK